MARKPVKTKVTTIPKSKRKGKYAGTNRKNIGGTIAQPPPLSRYKLPG